MRRYFHLLAVIAVLLTAAGCSQKKETLKVMSYNIRLGIADDGDNSWDFRKPATIEMLETLNPDIFGVQEAYNYQLSYITDNCPQYSCFGVGRDDGSDEGEHMSIFYDNTKFECLEWGNYWLSETPEVPSFGWDAACRRTATWALLKNKQTGSEFFFVNTHLDHIGVQARINGLALVVDKIADMNPNGNPMILTGDFNVEPDDICLVDLNTKMSSARATAEVSDTKPSFNGWGEASETIDYIYYSGFSCCKTFRVVDESFADKPYISDHYPVIAEIEF
ncbi:MAG: endonuclease/exonuclease/phosphatase family protein [Bacteroidales bacterium]|nr:endonuclease/exonuclease/phosphatase family protein [Bacteroidales bacterium]MCQ2141094.1 endonuclease/exonuclease/phosphatase family protein [Bacteroidales bacterium]